MGELKIFRSCIENIFARSENPQHCEPDFETDFCRLFGTKSVIGEVTEAIFKRRYRTRRFVYLQSWHIRLSIFSTKFHNAKKRTFMTDFGPPAFA